MGTGGILPKAITQSVSLYNTTGVIEKEKGIYFCPLISVNTLNQNVLVRNAWLTEFNSECDTDSNYKDIDISIWNPKDKVLTIKGNADDFRCNYQNGSALNYLILSRTKTYEDESTETVYYSFFINSASQVGNGSVRLELTQDHFTDVFFLQNERPLKDFKDAKGYVDVFNDMLKQNYVLRQHYDRVEKVYVRQTITDGQDLDAYPYEVMEIDSQYFKLNLEYQIELPEDATDLTMTVVNVVLSGVEDSAINNVYYTLNGNILEVIVEGEIHNSSDEQTIYNHDAEMELEIDYSYKADVYTGNVKETNLDVFSLTEEQFKYKRQTKDLKQFINYGDPMTEEELAEIKSYSESGVLPTQVPTTLINKLIKTSIAFAHITLNKNLLTLFCTDQFPTISSIDGLNKFDFKKQINNFTNLKSVNNGVITLVVPVFNPVYPYYTNYIKGIFNQIVLTNGNFTVSNIDESTITTSKISRLNVNQFTNPASLYTNYVLSIYISKESSLMNAITVANRTITINIDYYYAFEHNSSIADIVLLPNFQGDKQDESADYGTQNRYINRISNLGDPESIVYYKEDSEHETVEITLRELTKVNNDWSLQMPITSMYCFIERNEPIEFNLNLSEPVKAESYVMNNYYEPLLSFNPYSFYSVSYLGRIESVLNKLNYYQEQTIKCELMVSANNIFKYSFYPTYKINGKEIKYYSESIDQTLSNELTVYSSQLSSYLLQNRAQMKNQFAVNDTRGLTDVISGAIDTGASLLTGGVIGDITSVDFGATTSVKGGIGGGANLVNSVISWRTNNRITEMNQKAKLADLGNMPDNVKQVGTDIVTDLNNNELGLYLNHYSIDKLSYDSISKYLERFGYLVNIYSDLHVNTRVGWNYLQLISFDYHHALSVEQEESIRQIMQNGVTLLHRPHVLESGHNYEVMLEE